MSIVGWQTCAIGSSPNGADPSQAANVGCSPVSTNFNCATALNCYAVVSESVNDKTCLDNMSWGTWNTQCISDQQRKYFSKLNGIQGDPSTWMASCQQKIPKKGGTLTLPDGSQSKPVTSDGNCISKIDGMYGEVFIDGDMTCALTKFNENPIRTYCDGKNQIQYKMCTNWNNNDPNNCNTVKPPGVVGWQTCGIGSSPGGKEGGAQGANICSAISNNFNCV